MTIGYNTETPYQLSIPAASDEAEARWKYAFWLQNELTVIGDRVADPDGAAARHAWITELGLWYERPTAPDDWLTIVGPIVAQIEGSFNQACVQLARDLHTTGLIGRVMGRSVPVILHGTGVVDHPVPVGVDDELRT
ncbi:hypothetical protein [Kitasatospora sp. NPDC098663]|uniref:hypothetical protein n=1 Tax=Kitasatospora sp. NPDC098663 TaxID=3364096 RepID=UPI00380896C8